MNIEDLAISVVNSLNTQAWPYGFSATREYRPIFDLGDLESIRVVVVPRSIERTRLTRSLVVQEQAIQIGVLKRVENDSQIGQLVQFCDQITEYFAGATISSNQCVRVIYDPVYDPESLEKNRQFSGIITLFFKVFG